MRDRGEFTLEDGDPPSHVRHRSRVRRVGPGRVLAAGSFADVNVFDLDALACPLPEYVYDFPGGAGGSSRRAHGYDTTVVNGQVFMEAGEHTGALAGNLLRG